ncbi:MAG: potassium uptake protein, partial [Erysipelotrichaceae bacterium]|nr:potassium uptake protein [Erysipelotrichaceae bacterium]
MERFMKKYNMNNGQLFACSFVCVIFIGSILLSLPICRTAPASYIDNLFTALSATCVTGLLTVTIADT